MSYCIKCGKELREDEKFCSNCGRKRIDETVVNETNSPQPVMKCFTVFGNVGHALGIVTLVMGFIPIMSLYAFIFGIHGIVFSALGKKDTRQLEKCNKGLRRSIAGSIIGIILFIVTIVAMILLIPE